MNLERPRDVEAGAANRDDARRGPRPAEVAVDALKLGEVERGELTMEYWNASSPDA